MTKTDWQQVKLGDVCIKITDGSHWSPKTCEIGFPMASVKDMEEYKINLSSCRKISEKDYYELVKNDCKPLKNDVLIAKDGSYLKHVFEVKNEEDVVILSSIAIIRPNLKNIIPTFLKYIFKNQEFVEIVKNHYVSGAVIPRIVLKDFRNIPILLPPLDIQKKIAAVLGALDDKIELNNKINNNLEQQAQALFKSCFVDFEPFGGKMPADWKVGKLGEIAEIIMGQSPNGSTYNEEKNGCIFFQGRAEFGARFPKVRLYTTEPKRMANKGDVLMSVRAPVGDFNMAMEDCCIGRGLCAIRSKQNYQSFILYTVWASQDKLNVFNGEGTVFGSVNKDSLYNMLIIIPTNKIMQQFEYICSKLDMLIWNNSLENTKLAALRDTLLPKLMKGEIDVSNVDISELPSADKSQLIEDDSVKF